MALPLLFTLTMKIIKMLALSALVAVTAGVLTGCYVETGRWHHPHYVVVRR